MPKKFTKIKCSLKKHLGIDNYHTRELLPWRKVRAMKGE